MKVTGKEKELFNDMLEYAPKRDLFIILWWGLVSDRKQRVLMNCLNDGMNWRSAMSVARGKKIINT